MMSLLFTEYDRSHSLAGFGRSLLFAGLAAALLTAAAVAGTGDDCNGNGVDDAIDIASGTSEDCQGDGAPDECQITGSVAYAYDSGPTRTLGGPTPTLGAVTRFWAAAVFPFIGGVEFEGLDVPAGTTIGAGLWSDPNGDGNPNDGQLLAEGGTVATEDGSGRVIFAEGIEVGGDGTSFFVGIWFEGVSGGRFGFDESSVARQSWRLSAAKSFDPTAIDQHQRIRQPHHFIHLVTDIKDRNSTQGPEFGQHRQDLGLAGTVQGGQRFVHQQRILLHQQRASDRHPLALAPRQIAGPPVQQLGQP